MLRGEDGGEREKWRRSVGGGFLDETRSPPCTARLSDGGGAGSVAWPGAIRAAAGSDGGRLGSVAACPPIRFACPQLFPMETTKNLFYSHKNVLRILYFIFALTLSGVEKAEHVTEF